VKSNKKNKINNPHAVWHKFSNWMVKTFGNGLRELELSRKMTGYETMCKVEKFIKKKCPEIKIIICNDSIYSGSYLLLIPHPTKGITIMFIPQCTEVQNQFFLYQNNYQELVNALNEMSNLFKTSK